VLEISPMSGAVSSLKGDKKILPDGYAVPVCVDYVAWRIYMCDMTHTCFPMGMPLLCVLCVCRGASIRVT